jgi:hypothetical protein
LVDLAGLEEILDLDGELYDGLLEFKVGAFGNGHL